MVRSAQGWQAQCKKGRFCLLRKFGDGPSTCALIKSLKVKTQRKSAIRRTVPELALEYFIGNVA